MKLLVVDNDRNLVEMLTGWLKTLGYEVRRAYTGERVKQEWEEQQPDLVIIDKVLGDIDSLTMCREMCRKHDALVLVMAEGENVREEIRYLESGADDYIRKPFLPDQLLARIHTLTRRTRSTLAVRPSAILSIGSIRVDSLYNEVTARGKTHHLTPTESKLLHLLATNVNNVCTANQIVAYVWGFGDEGSSTLIKAHIRHLRQKIEPTPSKPAHILTIPGVGYTLVHQPVEENDAKDVLQTLRVVGR